ncbi:hypothetical protein HHUSO_G11090 [Huso huso]|uniref:Uncharacterized protein n=1 Tax=Huso huso TaxID=61971 RepID=A0ABR0ZKN3_HUSHU
MSGLSEKEKEGCKEILNSLSNTELFALKDTVTNRMITVESVKEAVQAIISYSQCAEELLKRKKVHREVIYTYLTNQGVVIPPNAEKHVLVKKALEYWKTPKPSVEVCYTEANCTGTLHLKCMQRDFIGRKNCSSLFGIRLLEINIYIYIYIYI